MEKVYCNVCSREIVVIQDYDAQDENGNNMLFVEPCKHCIEVAVREALNEAWDSANEIIQSLVG